MQPQDQAQPASVNFTVDPNKTKVLYADSYAITNNEYVVVLNFAQALVGTNQQNIVARIALTKPQAKEFLKNLHDHMEKFEV